MSDVLLQDVWKRLVSPLDDLTPAAARAILRLKLSPRDQSRVQRLCSKGSEGKLSAEEKEELDLFVQIGNLITLMHSKARLALKHRVSAVRRKSV
jgi:hypothetical protein